MNKLFKFLEKLCFLIFVLSFSALSNAQAEHTIEAYTRTTDNMTSPASFKLSKNIYRTQYYTQNECHDEPYTVDQTCYNQQWVSNMVCQMVTQADGSQNCNLVDQGSYQSFPYSCPTTAYRQVCQDVQYSEDVFDHTWNLQVNVQFPDDAALKSSEVESIRFKISGKETAPAITLDQRDTILHYSIAKSELIGGVLQVQLSATPFLVLKDVGPATIKNIALEFGDQSTTVSVVDQFIHARVDSNYRVAVFEKGLTTPLSQSADLIRKGEAVQAVLPLALDPSKDYDITLDVTRSGTVLVKSPVTFSVKKTVKAEVLEVWKLKNAALIGNFSLVGTLEKTTFRFRDLSPDYKTVHTLYQVRVLAIGKDKKQTEIGSGQFLRTSIPTASDGRFVLSLKDDLKLDPTFLPSLKKGQDLYVEVTAVRQSRRFKPDFNVQKKFALEVYK